jgi:ATP:corrinoid adenosyltransferase
VSHKGIRLLLEDTARSLGDDIQFDYGRTSDFNQLRDKRYPFISVSPLTASASYTVTNVFNYAKTYQVSAAFYQLDREDSGQDQYALILDEMNALADNFINKLNYYMETCLSSDELIITGVSQQPFIKATADILTGYIMTFSVQVTDDFNYCGLGC